jgi:hydrogenase nickel incorporation protein HypA/HybF
MHELSIAVSVVHQTAARVARAGVDPASVRLLRIGVGDLSGADPEALEACLREHLPASELPGAEAKVARVPARVVCPSCGEVDCPRPFRLACPSCGARPERLEGGRDIVVESVEVEDDGG